MSTLTAAWGISRAYTVLTLLHVPAVPLFLVLALTDPTTVDGAPLWAKPLKFGLSFLALGPAMLWIYARVDRTRAVRVLLELTGWAMVLEAVLITGQAARGRASHFNNETALDAVVFTVMGAAVGVFALAVAGLGLLLTRSRLGAGPLALAVRLAVLIMLGGSLIGFLMPGPRPGQDVQGPRIGAHSVGGADGGPGLPLLGWSTEHGDLRVSHFLGLHGLQVLPLAALALAWLAAAHRLDLSLRRQRLTVGLVATAWAGLTVVALVQALRAQPVVAPDGVTWATGLVLVVLPALAAAVVVATGRGSGATPEPAHADLVGAVAGPGGDPGRP
ncbi:hypothetical protein [Cellulomonas sp. S1-8]|uniref:hypothetical protein n=1 Tax=Cellulomonas sp. S1-8 TaxID=2904790 RepID=UPI00224406E5|nr:hypothetical protein [Cellulomonas sp. S1-8]UZN03750.1 hypothetical protein OKX07_02055 [Cellulomonas sp. S1-8]